jgi:hypothetical protein
MRWYLGVVAMVMLAEPACAGGITRPLIESGGWSTVEHASSASAAPDSCMIVEDDAAVALRSIGPAVDLMIANAHWDLPAGMHGVIHVATDRDSLAFPVTATTSNTAAARIDASALGTLLDVMAHGRAVRVMLFPGMPVTVPLAGFTAALPAFRHCAGLD